MGWEKRVPKVDVVRGLAKVIQQQNWGRNGCGVVGLGPCLWGK